MVPRRRLRGKQPAPRVSQEPLPAPLELEEEAQPQEKRIVYLVTFPHPRQANAQTGEKLVAPGSMCKLDILKCLKYACDNPVYVNSRFADGVVARDRAGIWREFHAP